MRGGRAFWAGAAAGAIVATVVVLAGAALVGRGGSGGAGARTPASATAASAGATVRLADGTALTPQQAAERIAQLAALGAFQPYASCAPLLSGGSLDAAVACMRSVAPYASP